MKLVYTPGAAWFDVVYDSADTHEFAETWPCTTVEGGGQVTFAVGTGDMVDYVQDLSGGSRDGEDWQAFFKDCQIYGLEELGKTVPEVREALHRAQRRRGKE